VDNEADLFTFTPKLKYSFKLNDVNYTSDKIAFGYDKNFNSESAALSSIQKYPKGGLVTVNYNPDNPNEAVLERKRQERMGNNWRHFTDRFGSVFRMPINFDRHILCYGKLTCY
jgi:hypothetical protein